MPTGDQGGLEPPGEPEGKPGREGLAAAAGLSASFPLFSLNVRLVSLLQSGDWQVACEKPQRAALGSKAGQGLGVRLQSHMLEATAGQVQIDGMSDGDKWPCASI